MSRALFRILCETKRLKCFVPRPAYAGRTWNLENQQDWKTVKESAPYDVWVHHAHFSDRIFEVVPRAKFVVTIARRPSLRFISAWKWYKHEGRLGITLEDFIVRSRYISEFTMKSLTPTVLNFLFGFKYRTGLDSTFTELSGLSYYEWWKYSESLDTIIAKMKQKSLFVLVTERMDESLVVLARHCGWKLHHLLYKRHKVSGDINLPSQWHLDALDNMQAFDSIIYNVANSMLDQMIHEYGTKQKFEDDLFQFRSGLVGINENCSQLMQQESASILANNNGGRRGLNSSNNDSCSMQARSRICRSLEMDNREGIEAYWRALEGHGSHAHGNEPCPHPAKDDEDFMQSFVGN